MFNPVMQEIDILYGCMLSRYNNRNESLYSVFIVYVLVCIRSVELGICFVIISMVTNMIISITSQEIDDVYFNKRVFQNV